MKAYKIEAEGRVGVGIGDECSGIACWIPDPAMAKRIVELTGEFTTTWIDEEETIWFLWMSTNLVKIGAMYIESGLTFHDTAPYAFHEIFGNCPRSITICLN